MPFAEKARSAARALGCLLTLSFALAPTAFAEEQSAVDPAARASRFVELLLRGPDDELDPMLTEAMRLGMGGAQREKIRAQIVGGRGALRAVGEAWMQDTVQGFRRFRVPVAFVDGEADLLVVIDGADRVAGLFPAPDDAPPKPAADTRQAPVRELEVTVGDADTGLPGTLSLPDGAGPFPAVVLVHGSGPQDRDQTLGPNKPFRDLAWGLAERGVTVLRYDKRSKARPQELVMLGKNVTVRDEVLVDVQEALRLLRGRQEVDGERIFVLGHSLGGSLVPRIAAAEPGWAGMIVLAGATLPLPEKVLAQSRTIAEGDGEVSQEEHVQLFQLEAAVRAMRAALDGKAAAPPTPLLGMPFRYLKDLESHDPPTVAASLERPILVLQGERDYQVTMADFARWQEALAESDGACLVAYEDLDHLFRPGSGPSTPADYQHFEPVAPRVIEDVAAWIGKRRCP